jgi:hypothetical protein
VEAVSHPTFIICKQYFVLDFAPVLPSNEQRATNQQSAGHNILGSSNSKEERLPAAATAATMSNESKQTKMSSVEKVVGE